MYKNSKDIQWYDKGVYNAINTLSTKYSSVVKNAIFYKWHEGTVGAVRRFCHLCLVDPALVELYFGMSIVDEWERC